VRVVRLGVQSLWTRQLVGKLGLVVRNERVGLNRVVEVLVDGAVHRVHPLDLEFIFLDADDDWCG